MKTLAWLPLVLLVTTGCASQKYSMDIPRPDISVSSHNLSLIKDRGCMVLTPELGDYVYKTSVYSWAWGWFKPDEVTFNIGKLVSAEIEKMRLPVINQGQEMLGGVTTCIVPQIVRSSLTLPIVRLGTITAEIEMLYSFVVDGRVLTVKPVTGIGKKRLVLTRENYALAFQAAAKDLMEKSTVIILKTFTSEHLL